MDVRTLGTAFSPLARAHPPAAEGVLTPRRLRATHRLSARVAPLRVAARAGLGRGFPALRLVRAPRCGGSWDAGAGRSGARPTGDFDMRTTLAAQLAQLELGHLSVQRCSSNAATE